MDTGPRDDAGLADALRDLVKSKRKELDLSQRDLAEAAGLSPATIASVEQGRRKPTETVLEGLRIAFELASAEELVELAERWRETPQEKDARDDLLSELSLSPLAFSSSGSSRSSGRQRLPGDLDRVMNALRATEAEHVEAVIEWLDRVGSDLATAAELPTPERLDWALAIADSEPVRRLDPAERDRFLAALHRLSRDPTSEGPPRIATVPVGHVHYLFAKDLATDSSGAFWVDPLARAYPSGLDAEDPRFERWDDGRIRLDLSRLVEAPEWPARDPRVHMVRAALLGHEPAEPSVLDEAYVTTIIEVDWHGETIMISPSDPTSGDRLPDGVDHIHIITAANPRSRLLSPAENDERNRLLSLDIEERGWTVWPSVGRAPDGTWEEASYAVIDVDSDAVRRLARRYEQNAVYDWSHSGVGGVVP